MRLTPTIVVLVCLGFGASVSSLPQGEGSGVYVEPKTTRAKCGGDEELDVGEETTFSSPGFPNKYPNRRRCSWKIVGKDPKSTLEVDCPNFDLQKSKKCKKDRLVLSDGQEMKEIFCGRGQKKFSTKTNQLSATFKTNNKVTAKGFQCTVRSVASSSTGGATSGYSYATSDNPGTTDKPPTTKPPGPKPPASGGKCKCGVSKPTRIVNGVEVSPPHKYPWHGGLKIKTNLNYWCGATIINDRYVLTAAHCFFDKYGNRESDEGLVVGIGDHDMSTTSDDVSGATRLVDVKKVVLHPNYDPRGYDYDMAILLLSETLDLTKHKEVGAVCLPKDDSQTYAGKTGIAAGWGQLSYAGSQPNKLMEVKLPILEPSCWGKSVSSRMLCAGYKEGGKDTCQGDSGGPLYVLEGDRYFQVGVTSFGDKCAKPNSPGVYARVSKFLPWIKTTTADASYCEY